MAKVADVILNGTIRNVLLAPVSRPVTIRYFVFDYSLLLFHLRNLQGRIISNARCDN
jgi:hypothetical protein